jgi:DNA-binding XRE family transcriptional regulator
VTLAENLFVMFRYGVSIKARENGNHNAKSKRGVDFVRGVQCKMARAALGLGVRELAEAADVSTNTVTRLEAGEELKPRTVAAIRQTLEALGVLFIDENGEGPGVRLRKERSSGS